MDPASIVEDTERTRFFPQTDGQADRRTDGQTDEKGETSIPPSTSFERGLKIQPIPWPLSLCYSRQTSKYLLNDGAHQINIIYIYISSICLIKSTHFNIQLFRDGVINVHYMMNIEIW